MSHQHLSKNTLPDWAGFPSRCRSQPVSWLLLVQSMETSPLPHLGEQNCPGLILKVQTKAEVSPKTSWPTWTPLIATGISSCYNPRHPNLAQTTEHSLRGESSSLIDWMERRPCQLCPKHPSERLCVEPEQYTASAILGAINFSGELDR